jgi:hypothetical protein
MKGFASNLRAAALSAEWKRAITAPGDLVTTESGEVRMIESIDDRDPRRPSFRLSGADRASPPDALHHINPLRLMPAVCA